LKLTDGQSTLDVSNISSADKPSQAETVSNKLIPKNIQFFPNVEMTHEASAFGTIGIATNWIEIEDIFVSCGFAYI
jgi:hypothetical protein